MGRADKSVRIGLTRNVDRKLRFYERGISGGTKLFVRAQFGVLEQTMVQIRVPFPQATALFVASVEFACGAGLALGLLTPLCAAMLAGDMIRRDHHHLPPARYSVDGLIALRIGRFGVEH